MIQNKGLPKMLEDRLKNIFSKEEMSLVNKAFSVGKRNVCLRVNTLKSTFEEIQEALSNAGIEFHVYNTPKVFVLNNAQESDIWKLDIYTEGKIYLQSFSSQLPVNFMELGKGMYVLDATAAPGGKTSQISEKVGKSGKVVACELSTIRREKMEHNLKKLGCDNVEVVGKDAQSLGEMYAPETFDAILFDAPCSGEGSIQYEDEKFLKNWDISHIVKNYKRQRDILKAIIPLLKVGGVLMYSTCTLAPEENEAIVHFILCNYKNLEIEKIPFEYEYIKPGILHFENQVFTKKVAESLRIIPNVQSEGFFMAKFRKKIES